MNLFVIYHFILFFVSTRWYNFQLYFFNIHLINLLIFSIPLANSTKYQFLISINQFKFISTNFPIYKTEAFLFVKNLLTLNFKSHSKVLQKF